MANMARRRAPRRDTRRWALNRDPQWLEPEWLRVITLFCIGFKLSRNQTTVTHQLHSHCGSNHFAQAIRSIGGDGTDASMPQGGRSQPCGVAENERPHSCNFGGLRQSRLRNPGMRSDPPTCMAWSNQYYRCSKLCTPWRGFDCNFDLNERDCLT